MNSEALLPHMPELTDQLGAEHVAALVDHGEVLQIPDGSILVQDQNPIDALYLVLEGGLRLSIQVADHTITLGEINPGNWVGEVALFSESPISADTITAMGDTSLFKLSFEAFHAMRRADSQAACRLTHVLIAMLVRRLRATSNDPVLEPDGQLLMLGDMNVPPEKLASHKQSLLAAFKSLFGVH